MLIVSACQPASLSACQPGVQIATKDPAIDHLHHPLATLHVPLEVHARYSRIEILAAFGVGDSAKVAPWQTGVYWAEEAHADLLAFTLASRIRCLATCLRPLRQPWPDRASSGAGEHCRSMIPVIGRRSVASAGTRA